MWQFEEVLAIEQRFGKWEARVKFDKDGVCEAFFLNFGENKPSITEVAAKAEQHASRLTQLDADRTAAATEAAAQQAAFEQFLASQGQ